MLFSSRIKELEGQLSAITGERDTLLASNTELSTANAECKAMWEADQATIRTLTAERDTAVANVTTLTTERDNALASIDTEVTRRLAAAGTDPIKRDPAAPEGGTSAQAPGEIKAAYAAIEDKEARFAFYQKHSAVLNN